MAYDGSQAAHEGINMSTARNDHEHLVDLPTGMVTFLFTDIQGSTPLWEQHPAAMKTAVALHHRIVRQAIEVNGGVIFKIIGDAFQAAFSLTGHALAAAVAAQRELQSAEWPTSIGALAVRMGVHVGPAEVERTTGGSDYAVSHTLNRVARIMSAGQGGQILLSREAADLIEHDLPADIALKDLGDHQLKGMARPERLFQVNAPGLPQDFGPLAASLSVKSNLPAALTSFIGREAELRSLQTLVASGPARLVTLTGPGGTGKTRLALEAANGLLGHFADGIWLVELAPLADPALIPQSVASALGLHETPGKTFTQTLIDYLRNRRLLLILDNCEHVVDAAAGLAGTLLQACQRLQILATSREILGTMGETPFRVPSLALPGGSEATLATLAECESVRLFVERARTAQPSFALTDANAGVIGRICRRLDGIPLAIELAAARVRLLKVDEIAARLDDSFRLLTGGSRTVLSRHQTLRALIDWSFNLLTADERLLFLRLSVFAGGFTLAAAETICSDDALDRAAILDLLAQLVDKSLVVPFDASTVEAATAAAASTAETRYRLLETIRQYARDRLHDVGGSTVVRGRHLDYFVALAEEAEPHFRQGDQVVWLDRLEAELDNVRAALEWALSTSVDLGLRLTGSLLWFWHIRGHRNEGMDWARQFVATQGELDDSTPVDARLARARALIAIGFLAQFQNQADQGGPPLEQAIAILRGAGPDGQRWLGVAQLFFSKAIRDRADRARLLTDTFPLLREAGDPLYLAEYSMDLGGLYSEQNRMDDAEAALRESLRWREIGQDLDGIGTACLGLGDIALLRHNFDQARQHYEKGHECFRTVRNRTMESILLSRLGQVSMILGDMAGAARRYTASMTINQESGDRVGLANSLFDLGRLELNTGQPRRAERYFAEITQLGADIGLPEAVVVGLLFQGLAASEMDDRPRVDECVRRAIDFWRRVQPGAFSPEFIVNNLENLAVLLSDSHPGVARQLFATVDRKGSMNRLFNTAFEISAYAKARERVNPQPAMAQKGDEASGEPTLSLEDAVTLALTIGEV